MLLSIIGERFAACSSLQICAECRWQRWLWQSLLMVAEQWKDLALSDFPTNKSRSLRGGGFWMTAGGLCEARKYIQRKRKREIERQRVRTMGKKTKSMKRRKKSGEIICRASNWFSIILTVAARGLPPLPLWYTAHRPERDTWSINRCRMYVCLCVYVYGTSMVVRNTPTGCGMDDALGMIFLVLLAVEVRRT